MGLIDSYRFVPRDRFKRSREYEILPDGYFDLAFLLSESTCKILLAGPYTQKTNVPLGHFELIIVHFRVGRMPNFTNISPSELVNTMVELPRIYGSQQGQTKYALLFIPSRVSIRPSTPTPHPKEVSHAQKRQIHPAR